MANDNILQAPRHLNRTDDTSKFTCGVETLDDWFQRFALTNHRSNNAVVYVSTLNDEIVGFYAIATGAVSHNEAGPDFSRNRPNPIPVIILARLAVIEKAQGHGVGKALLQDALNRMITVSETVGAAALIIHAADENAKQFYLNYADFQEMPDNPLHLLLSTKSIRRMSRS